MYEVTLMKQFLEKNKVLIIVFIIIIVILVALFWLYSLVAPDYRKSLYGNRLESIEKHKIKDDKINTIKKEVKSLDYVEKIDYNLKGKIMNFVIVVTKETSIQNSKKIGKDILEKLDANEKENYDIQVFLITKEENSSYPIIGYKHKTSDELVWTK